ncbi:MAG: hypothetical protein LLF94_12040 [Chlamydiales bacterium]|nr:hypothetical protein [Chlamydiales bacterium]
MNLLLESFSSLLFPSLCIHCSGDLEDSLRLLCRTCMTQIECIDPHNRCPTCFLEDCICHKTGKRSYNRLACCFEYEGPQKSLLIALKYQDRPYLAKSLAAFMFLQHEILGWQAPDVITYIPQSFLRATLRGYNQSELLAKHLADLMQKPVLPLLKRTSFTLSQTLLTKEERSKLSSDIFQSASGTHNNRILLIDDVMTTGSTVECAANALLDTSPLQIDVLCLMRSE